MTLTGRRRVRSARAVADSSLVVLAFGDGLELDTAQFEELDTAQFELRRAGRPVPMELQAFDVLT